MWNWHVDFYKGGRGYYKEKNDTVPRKKIFNYPPPFHPTPPKKRDFSQLQILFLGGDGMGLRSTKGLALNNFLYLIES